MYRPKTANADGPVTGRTVLQLRHDSDALCPKEPLLVNTCVFRIQQKTDADCPNIRASGQKTEENRAARGARLTRDVFGLEVMPARAPDVTWSGESMMPTVSAAPPCGAPLPARMTDIPAQCPHRSGTQEPEAPITMPQIKNHSALQPVTHYRLSSSVSHRCAKRTSFSALDGGQRRAVDVTTLWRQ
ncbi:hypothetical protein BaRGS_00024181, partial [Batillaria attramentaria]